MTLTRRRFLTMASQAGAGLAVAPSTLADTGRTDMSCVNDIHSQLNPTFVREIASPDSVAGIRDTVRRAARSGFSVSIAGGRHAMGGQQFGEDTLLLDTRSMNRILEFDSESGHVEVEAGIQWPELIQGLVARQQGQTRQWGIIQKQTGADRLCVGGAVGANVHGRGLTMKPFVDDIESLRMVDARGDLIRCSRTKNRELFRLVVGGYGLFGVVSSVTLRLARRRMLRREVDIVDLDDLMNAFDQRIRDGYVYGDCQFSIDPASDGFMKTGVFSCYRPVDGPAAVGGNEEGLGEKDWQNLYLLAHEDPARAFEVYSSYYVSTSGRVYWSDTHQLSSYTDDYHKIVDSRMGARRQATEMITEVYVPRPALGALMDELAADFRRHDVKVIYGTIRLIARDDETFLAWAREPFVCVVMNLHVPHSPQKIAKAVNDFRRVITRAIDHDGSFFLTYHRWATREQIEYCYPEMGEFLEHKRRYDPGELFQSDWYRHLRRMFT